MSSGELAPDTKITLHPGIRGLYRRWKHYGFTSKGEVNTYVAILFGIVHGNGGPVPNYPYVFENGIKTSTDILDFFLDIK